MVPGQRRSASAANKGEVECMLTCVRRVFNKDEAECAFVGWATVPSVCARVGIVASLGKMLRQCGEEK